MDSEKMINSKSTPAMRRTKATDHRDMDENCRQVCVRLPEVVFGPSDDDELSDVFEHLSQCRRCLEAYIALQAAAELASEPRAEA